jgi:hypothetical protein
VGCRCWDSVVRIATGLWAVWSRVRIPVRARYFLQYVHTVYGASPAFYLLGFGHGGLFPTVNWLARDGDQSHRSSAQVKKERNYCCTFLCHGDVTWWGGGGGGGGGAGGGGGGGGGGVGGGGGWGGGGWGGSLRD